MNDADTLIYDDGKFIAPSELEVGDAIMEIREGELYAKVADASGELTRSNTGTVDSSSLENNSKVFQHKVTIGGTNYVYENYAAATDKTNPAPEFYDEDFESAGISIDDVYNNNVKYLLNKDNSVAAIVVDETSTGTTLYGIVVDGGGNNGTWASNMSSITLFTHEGYTVTYDFDKDCTGKPAGNAGGTWMGRMVEYKLNSNGEIKTFKMVGSGAVTGVIYTGAEMDLATDGEIEVKNNAYLVDNAGKQLSLASNVVIFEVGQDGSDIDPSLVTRSSLLSGGDFEPEQLTGIMVAGNAASPVTAPINPFAAYQTNNNGAIKALAYTNSSSSNYHYGVVKTWKFTDADHAGNGDYAVTLVGDDTVYDLDLTNTAVSSGADQFIIYKLSGDKLTVVASIKNDGNLNPYTRSVQGYNDGLITVADGWMNYPKHDTFYDGNGKRITNLDKDTVEIANDRVTTTYDREQGVYSVMTDSNTVVYVLDSNSGDYKEGSLSDISRNSWVYVPVIDKDGYADVVLIDEYPRTNNSGSGSTSAPSSGKLEITYYTTSDNFNNDLPSSVNTSGVTAKYSVSGTTLTITTSVPANTNYSLKFRLNNGSAWETSALKPGTNEFTIPAGTEITKVEIAVIDTAR